MDRRVADGKIVCLSYTLSLLDGTPIDSSADSGTWTYVHGQTKMPSGLVKGLEGCQEGEHIRLELAPEEAFGAVDPTAFHQLPKDHFPASALYVGHSSEVAGPGGSVIAFRIHEIHDETVTINLNHPLAGEQVVFDVTVVHVQD
ncbi:MAG: peptidylprolyl isomerase [Candidatus Tectimicrobiota bacterium]